MSTTIGTVGALAGGLSAVACAQEADKTAGDDWFKISLAQWSVNGLIFGGKLDNLDFAKFAHEQCGIKAVEYVNQFFMDKVADTKYLTELKKRSADLGVRNVLIMCDKLGLLGDADEKKRLQAVEAHQAWVEAAKFLGCHSIRVNAYGHGEPAENAKRVADGMRRLCEFAAPHKIDVIIENHGGVSSDPDWVVDVIKQVAMDNCGTLPDFGNFGKHDRYEGIRKFMPYARGVSAKSNSFDDNGEEKSTDFLRAMKIVKQAGFKGFVGVEYEGQQLSQVDGILATKKLLEKVRAQLA